MPTVSTLLDHIDSGHIVLPVFQRGYVWNRDQVKNLFESMYKQHPVGGILVWATRANSADYRGDGPIADGTVKFLLDGQQRITSLYGVIRGKAPDFFDGDIKPFTELMFNLDSEIFSFYQPMKMKDDPLWIDLTKLMKSGISEIFKELQKSEKFSENTESYTERLIRILSIKEANLPDQEITGSDKDISTVVDIFNRVNSGGTKLSKGDLALAKICSEWPEARDKMKEQLKRWSESGYKFSLDWLLRSVNVVATNEAKFSHLEDRPSSEIQDSLKRASKYIDETLNLIAGGLGLDHDRVFFGRFGVPIMVCYLDMKNGKIDAEERDKLLFWFAQSGMWGRFSASTETVIDQDLDALKKPNALDSLLDNLRQFRGNLHVEPSNFIGSTRGARFYPVLYMLTRMGDAKDWGNGITLKSNMHGDVSSLELHHIFPKSQLKKKKYKTTEINSLGNFCFQTKATNLRISDRLPEDYFTEIEKNHPGVLESHLIPMDKELWKVDRYLDFLEARRDLLATEANNRFRDLLNGDPRGLMNTSSSKATSSPLSEEQALSSEFDEDDLPELNDWVEGCGLCRGEVDFDLADPESGEQIAVLDLAWPHGLQFDLTGPVAVLLGDSGEVLKAASAVGYRCFTEVKEFRDHVENEFLDSEN